MNLPSITRGLRRKDWTVREPNGDIVATYSTRERARRWVFAAGFERWIEESWVQLRCVGTPRATRQVCSWRR